MIAPMYEYKLQALREFYFLPLFYIIPREYLAVRKLDSFPRNPFVAVSSPKWRKLYHTRGWQAEIAEVWAFMVWPHLEIRGTPTHYTIDDPFLRMAYTLPLWAELLKEAGFDHEMLMILAEKYNDHLPYIPEKEAVHNCKYLAKQFWNHPDLEATKFFEIVQEHRAHADFAKRRTAVYIDFLRKYYHTRAKVKSIPLQNAGEEHELVIEDNPDIDNVVGNDWIEKFYGWLDNQKDIEICKLLYIGRTQKEIAQRLGYANHSGVNKRIAKIRDILDAFVQWQRDLEEAPPPVSKPSTIRYDIIEFSYKRK